MTGTAQDQKKAYRIISSCREFFRTYIDKQHNPDKFEVQAFEEAKEKILPDLEKYTDAAQLIADRQKFADRVLIMQILTRAEILRKWDPEYHKEIRRQKREREQRQFQRIQDRWKNNREYC